MRHLIETIIAAAPGVAIVIVVVVVALAGIVAP